MQTAEINFGGVVSQCAGLIRSHIALTLVTIFIITAGFSLLDLIPNRSASAVPGIVVNLYGQYHFVKALMSERIAGSQRKGPKYGSLLLAGLLGGLGILAGSILLIIPGIFLMARWSISTPFIVADEMSGVAALKASWEATFEARWVLSGLFLLCCTASCILFFAVIAASEVLNWGPDSLVLSVLSNLVISLWLVGGWILGVGIYRCLRPSSSGLAEVFS